MLRSTGEVSCAMPNTHDAVCIQHNSKWPYNVQTCEITYGSWSYVGNEVDLKLTGKGYSTKQFEANNEWALNNVTIEYNAGKYNCCPDDAFPTIKVEFTLAHHSDVHVATMVAPAIGKFYGELWGLRIIVGNFSFDGGEFNISVSKSIKTISDFFEWCEYFLSYLLFASFG